MIDIKQFVNANQLSVIRNLQHGEESTHFFELEHKVQKIINTMPKTYEQDGKGDDAIVYLHYFINGFDWYITERDMGDRQIQAFGLAKIQTQYAELGYISIEELITNNVELDLHFTPTRVGNFK